MDKNKGGRPAFEANAKDREAVKLMAGHNIGQDKIALALGITEKTLRKHFKKELLIAAAHTSLRRSQPTPSLLTLLQLYLPFGDFLITCCRAATDFSAKTRAPAGFFC